MTIADISGETRLSDLPAHFNAMAAVVNGANSSLGSLNVKAFSAVGDGVTDDTAAIQAAIDAATEGQRVFLPTGDYLISDTLEWSHNIHITGAGARNADGAIGSVSGTRIYGDVAAGPLLHKLEGGDTGVIEDLALRNTAGDGYGIKMDRDVADDGGAVFTPSGVYRCNIKAHVCLDFAGFTIAAHDCTLRREGALAGSGGIVFGNHCSAFNCDVTGFESAYYLPFTVGNVIIGGRVETCTYGVNGGFSGTVQGISFEANDVSMALNGMGSATVMGCRILGSVNAPSGASLIGIDIGECNSGLSILDIGENGAHTTAFIRVQSTANRRGLLIAGCGDSSAFSLPADKHDITLIGNGANNPDLVRAPVIATASLPAVGAGEDGRLIIEDAGDGDQNLIVYANGERYRIDGGSTF